jgi:DNA-binding CsgD family transcriptional regulator
MKLTPSPELESIIARLHQATGRIDDWTEVLAGVRELFQGRLAALGRYHFLSGQGSKIAVTPPNEPFRSEYATQHAIRNPWFIASQEYRSGRVMTGDELLRQDDLIRTDFYQQFLRKYGLHHRLCGVLTRTEESTLYLDVYRDDTQPAFGDHDKRVLHSVIGHLAPALENHWALLHLDSLNRLLQAVVDGFAPAIFLVDRDGLLLFASHKAPELLDGTTGLQRRGARLAAGNRMEDRALLEAIAQIAGHEPSPDGAGIKDAGIKVVPLFNGNGNGNRSHPLVITAHPAGQWFCTETSTYRQAVMLVIKSPEAFHDVEQCAFAQVYQLTNAQARLTGLLLAGYSLSRAAECMLISENTARSHLKQVFQKTDTHRQIELVHLHARICTG